MKRLLKFCLSTLLILFILLNIITAFHAYKFTHFYDAGEITVKNKADKNGWDKTKEILFGINAVKQKDTAGDSLQEKVILITASQLQLEGCYVPVDSAKGTVCLFHGHGGTKSAVNTEAAAFRKMGYNTLQIDFRAHGSSGGNTCTIGYNESEDVKLAYDFIVRKGEKNIVLWGISMGAATITKAINDYSLLPAKIILEMPFATILEAVEGRIKLMGLPAEPVAGLVTFWGGIEHGFWAFNMKPAEFVKKIQCPVLLQWGINDLRVTSQEMDHIYSNIHTAKKLVHYDDSGHESLCKKENEKWVTEVSDFLK
jgi:alpha-beta hydrolase superfamily lysophospholipase